MATLNSVLAIVIMSFIKSRKWLMAMLICINIAFSVIFYKIGDKIKFIC